MKICEAITDRSQLGQMRLRCQDLEQNINIWRKKSVQLEKQVNFCVFYCKILIKVQKSSLSLVTIFVLLLSLPPQKRRGQVRSPGATQTFAML